MLTNLPTLITKWSEMFGKAQVLVLNVMCMHAQMFVCVRVCVYESVYIMCLHVYLSYYRQ